MRSVDMYFRSFALGFVSIRASTLKCAASSCESREFFSPSQHTPFDVAAKGVPIYTFSSSRVPTVSPSSTAVVPACHQQACPFRMRREARTMGALVDEPSRIAALGFVLRDLGM